MYIPDASYVPFMFTPMIIGGCWRCTISIDI